MEKLLSLTKSFQVYSFHCNNKGKIRVSDIAKFLQESAWDHAEQCGAGYHNLKPLGLLWILHGLKIEIGSFPAWNDSLKLRTWGKKYENLFAYRDFEICQEGSESPIIRATSSWLLVDSVSHRPQRIRPELQKITPNDEHALHDKPGMIQLEGSFNSHSLRRTLYDDIDIYDHVNNTRYIQFCMDSVPDLQEQSDRIKSFDIRFVQESRLNDNLKIRYRKSTEGYDFLGENSESGKEIFRARADLLNA